VIMITDLIPNSVDFKAKNSGHFINIGSIAGREPYVGGSIYNATKFAVNAFTGSLLRELVNTSIRVSEIQPGNDPFSYLLDMLSIYFSRHGGDRILYCSFSG